MYVLLTQILQGETIDVNLALALINVARLDFEGRRPWQVLKASAPPVPVAGGGNYTTPYTLPSPSTPSLATPYLMRHLLNGGIRLANAQGQVQKTLKQVPYENQLDYQGQEYFYVDYANRLLYILANLPAAYFLWQFFIADFGDITTTTSWVGFPPTYAKALVYNAAARYRLGVDYDDLGARNAEDNYKTGEIIYTAMVMWDAQISSEIATNRPLGNVDTYPSPGSNNVGTYGYG
jgi:hypothetical protein